MAQQRESSDSARSDSLLFSNSESELELVDEKLKTWTTKGGWKFQQNKIVWGVAAGMVLLLLAAISLLSGGGPVSSGAWKSDASSKSGIFPAEGVQSKSGVFLKVEACTVCNCSAPIPYYNPPMNLTSFVSRSAFNYITPRTNTISVNNFMYKSIFDIYCAQAHLNKDQARELLHVSMRRTEDSMTWSLKDLDLGKKTIYLTTATSPRSKANPYRPQYIQRHAKQISHWMRNQELFDSSDEWQIVWIVVEDDSEVDPIVARVLKSSGIPHVYFSYGQTNAWGNAQKNAAFEMAFALSRPLPRGLTGHGPVYGLDDDNFAYPYLYSMLTTVTRIGVFPVAMTGRDGTVDFVEGPIVDEKGTVVGSNGGPRKFGYDYGAFTFNSSLLGSVLKGPRFWNHDGYAGETEFVDRIVDNSEGLEPLCLKYKYGMDAGCNYVQHNKPLAPAEKTLEDPIAASLHALLAKPE